MAERIFAIEVDADSSYSCGVKNCKNSTIIKKLGLFPIPSEDKRELRSKWLRNIGYNGESKKKKKKFDKVLVCEAHFKHQYKNYIAFVTRDKSLTIDAIPTENVPYENPLEELNVTRKTRVFSAEAQAVSEEQGATEKIFCEQYLGTQLNTVIEIHKKLVKKPDNCSFEFTSEFKNLIANIYLENTQAYRIMRSIIGLPLDKDIKEFIQSKPEIISEKFISILRTQVDSMSNDEVNCALCVYLLPIEPSYDFDIELDIILGCCQRTNDTNQILTPAKYALMAMARGISDGWHQIVSFSLLPHIEDQSNFNELIKPWIENVVVKLLGIGLNLKVLIPTTDSLLINAFLHMRISEEEPYLKVNGKEIFYIFDPFNLMKLITTKIRRKEVQLKNMSTMWNHIKDFHKIDVSRESSFAPYLDENALVGKANQTYQQIFQNAAQVLSRNVAAGMSIYVDMKLLNQPAMRTARFIKNINDLIDTRRTNSKPPNIILSNIFSSNLFEKYDDDIWVNLVSYFKELKPPNSNFNGDHFIDCIITTLHNIRLLRNNLERENKNMYMARFLNQDPLVAIIDEGRLHFSKDFKRNLKAKELIQVLKDHLMDSANLHDRKKERRLVMDRFVEMAKELIEINIYQ